MQTSSRRADRVLIGAAVVASVFLLLQLLSFGFGRDQGIYAVVAEGMLEGRAPYRGTWDFKPPGIFFIYAAARFLFGHSTRAIRYVEASGLVSLFAAFAVLSQR